MITHQSEILVPPLKWAGGKRWLASEMSRSLPTDFKRYIEPFFGGGAMYFHLKPNCAVLSDLNRELVEFYQCIRNGWPRLERHLRVHSDNHDDDYYYFVRSTSPQSKYERAARLLYLNRTCWNGLYRVNSEGTFNVPRGSKDKVLLDTDDFSSLSKQFRGSRIICSDFEEVLNDCNSSDFVFLDPPYTVKHNHNGFVKYNESLFTWEDQIRLRDSVENLARKGTKLLITNANHASIRRLYKGFKMKSISRTSKIAAKAEHRVHTSELVIQTW